MVEALARHDCAVTALDLDDELRRRKPAVGRASIYRALEQLEQLGLLRRLEVSRGIAGYERIEPDGEHHHHAICRDCGRMVPFEDASLERAIDKVSGRMSFDAAEHEVVSRALRALRRLTMCCALGDGQWPASSTGCAWCPGSPPRARHRPLSASGVSPRRRLESRPAPARWSATAVAGRHRTSRCLASDASAAPSPVAEARLPSRTPSSCHGILRDSAARNHERSQL